MNEANKAKAGMDVICSCGKKIGQVEQLVGDMIKLKKFQSNTNENDRFVPVEWVESVDTDDRNVILNRNSQEVETEWAEESISV